MMGKAGIGVIAAAAIGAGDRRIGDGDQPPLALDHLCPTWRPAGVAA